MLVITLTRINFSPVILWAELIGVNHAATCCKKLVFYFVILQELGESKGLDLFGFCLVCVYIQ